MRAPRSRPPAGSCPSIPTCRLPRPALLRSQRLLTRRPTLSEAISSSTRCGRTSTSPSTPSMILSRPNQFLLSPRSLASFVFSRGKPISIFHRIQTPRNLTLYVFTGGRICKVPKRGLSILLKQGYSRLHINTNSVTHANIKQCIINLVR